MRPPRTADPPSWTPWIALVAMLLTIGFVLLLVLFVVFPFNIMLS